jgi:hypothetical protein
MANLPDDELCPDCGWQFQFYSGQPSEALTARLQTRCQLKQERQSKYLALERMEREFRQKIKEVEPHHQIQKENYEQVLPEYNLLVKQLEEEWPSIGFKDVERLEEQVKEQQQQIDKLYDKIPPGYHHRKKPNVTLSCYYNVVTNQLEIVVVEVLDKFVRAKLDVVLAVAFFPKPWVSFHDAALVIPTELKQVEVIQGTSMNLNLMFKPPQSLINNSHFQVIHLTSNNLSQFHIK